MQHETFLALAGKTAHIKRQPHQTSFKVRNTSNTQCPSCKATRSAADVCYNRACQNFNVRPAVTTIKNYSRLLSAVGEIAADQLQPVVTDKPAA